MHDELGERMKSQYEVRTRHLLPRRTYTIIRIDGKAFHSYTKDCQKPFDKGLIMAMNGTAQFLCKEIQGAQLAYVQSDEISILLTDFATPNTDAWFDGNIQKIVSVSASLATAEFNWLRSLEDVTRHAYFDARVFSIPDRTEVANYFIWRNNDAARNSISQVAHSLYSHRTLHGKCCNEMQELIFQKGINWSEYDESLKNGRLIVKKQESKTLGFSDPWFLDSNHVVRTFWSVEPAWVFARDQESLYDLIPKYI